MQNCSATFSAVTLICTPVHGSSNPSCGIESTNASSPMETPQRAFPTRYGAFVMLSMPPATTMSASPAAIACAPSATAFRPDPHTSFTVNAGTSMGTPASTLHRWAGFSPSPAWSTWPMTTSSTASGRTPARLSASWMTKVPSWIAEKLFNPPPNVPMAVRQAPAITTSRIMFLPRNRPRSAPASRSRPPARTRAGDPVYVTMPISAWPSMTGTEAGPDELADADAGGIMATAGSAEIVFMRLVSRFSLLREPAAVHRQRDAADLRRRLGAQKGHRGADLVRRGELDRRLLLGEQGPLGVRDREAFALGEIVDLPQHERREDPARADGVARDPGRGRLERHHLVRPSRPCSPRRTPPCGWKNRVPSLDGKLLDGRGELDARVVDQDVHRA